MDIDERQLNKHEKTMNKYDAFISYSHAADGKLAPALQQALQNIAKPFLKRRALHIFRDQTSLSATPHLWKNIEEALDNSRYLILLASPKSVQSKWVIKEIDFWLKNKSVDTILIALTDGDILWDDEMTDFDWTRTNALPTNLKGKFQMEPLYINLKEAKTSEDLSLKNPIFKNKAAPIAATVHGKSVGDLIGEDVRIQRRNLFSLYAVIFALLAFSSIAAWSAWQSKISEARAKEQEKIALQNEARAKEQEKIAIQNEARAKEQEKIALQNEARAKQQRKRAENALVEAYSNQKEILIRDRNKVINRIELAKQAGRPQDTVEYYKEVSSFGKAIVDLNFKIDTLIKNN